MAAFNQGFGLDPGDVVMAAPVAALDKGNIAEAGSGDIAHRGALAL